MSTSLLRTALAGLALTTAAACATSPSSTRLSEQDIDPWPLEVSSIRVGCTNEALWGVVGDVRYAIDDKARTELGYPSIEALRIGDRDLQPIFDAARANC